MSATRTDLIAAAKLKAQSSAGVPLLEGGSGDAAYDEALSTALSLYQTHRARTVLLDHAVTVAGWRFVLAGTGAILTDAVAWTVGASRMTALWAPYRSDYQGLEPNDPNTWRVAPSPDGEVLEILNASLAVGDTLRLAYTRPHVVSEDPQDTSLPSGDLDAFATLTASIILTIAAARYAQNTGTSHLPGDIVDRRSQSDIMASRAKDLRALYNQMMGLAAPSGSDGRTTAGSTVRPYSAVRDLDLQSPNLLWHPRTDR